jgi:F-type H+-transporting ATPase subunit delta
MASSKVAARYAVSLFEVALEAGVLDKVNADMINVLDASKSNKDFIKALQSPVIPTSNKSALLKTVFSSSQKETTSFFDLITSKNRSSELLFVAQEFQNLYNSHNGIVEVNVETATDLSESKQNELTAFLEKQTGAKRIALNINTNPDLIGGMVVKYGDRLLDNSILSQINKLKKELDIA